MDCCARWFVIAKEAARYELFDELEEGSKCTDTDRAGGVRQGSVT